MQLSPSGRPKPFIHNLDWDKIILLAFDVAPIFAASMASSMCISTGGYTASTSGATTNDDASLSGSVETTAAGHLAIFRQS